VRSRGLWCHARRPGLAGGHLAAGVRGDRDADSHTPLAITRQGGTFLGCSTQGGDLHLTHHAMADHSLTMNHEVPSRGSHQARAPSWRVGSIASTCAAISTEPSPQPPLHPSLRTAIASHTGPMCTDRSHARGPAPPRGHLCRGARLPGPVPALQPLGPPHCRADQAAQVAGDHAALAHTCRSLLSISCCWVWRHGQAVVRAATSCWEQSNTAKQQVCACPHQQPSHGTAGSWSMTTMHSQRPSLI
jgi:hypothetical protein